MRSRIFHCTAQYGYDQLAPPLCQCKGYLNNGCAFLCYNAESSCTLLNPFVHLLQGSSLVNHGVLHDVGRASGLPDSFLKTAFAEAKNPSSLVLQAVKQQIEHREQQVTASVNAAVLPVTQELANGRSSLLGVTEKLAAEREKGMTLEHMHAREIRIITWKWLEAQNLVNARGLIGTFHIPGPVF